MVNENHVVDSANRLMRKIASMFSLLEQPLELFLRVIQAHGIPDSLSQLVDRSRFFQFVFGRRIQRSVKDRIGRPAVGFKVRPETLHAGVDIHSPVFIKRFEHLLPEEHLGFILIYLLLVIIQRSTGRGARSYIRNHSLACFARFKISILRVFNSLMRCSNAAI